MEFAQNNTSARGGKRAGAGRKPDQFKKAFEAAAKRIITQDEMDALVASTLSEAKSGNVKAAALLFDRLLGKVPQAITGDSTAPITVRIVYDDTAITEPRPDDTPA